MKGQSEHLPDPEAYFTAIIVNNMDQSLQWYTNTFGFSVLNKTVSQEKGFKLANLKRGSVLIELIELKSAVSPSVLLEKNPDYSRTTGFFKFGFAIREFDKWVDFLKRSDVVFHGTVVTDGLTGKKMLIVKDPDGNSIQIFEK